MSLATTVAAMAAAGCTADQIAEVVKAHYAREKADAEEKRAERRRDVSESEWWAIRAFVLARDGFRCVYCGGDGDEFPLHADHVIPRSRGGLSRPDNLVAACHRCNSSKRDRTPEEWRGA